jgi:hypothetical protein
LTQDANWDRFLSFNWHRVLELLDLREENTIATWFSSILFLLAAMSFILLGLSGNKNYYLTHQQRLSVRFAALGFCALSADEVGSMHETVGTWTDRTLQLLEGTPIYGKGYPWLLATPLIVIIFIFIIYNLYQVTRLSQFSEQLRLNIRLLLWSAAILLPSVFVFEFIEAYLGYLRQKDTPFPVIEEMLELFGVFSVFLANVLIARHFRL